MKYIHAALAAVIATPALAHPGHVAEADGHTHTFADLAMMGAIPAVAAGVVVVAVLLTRRNRND